MAKLRYRVQRFIRSTFHDVSRVVAFNAVLQLQCCPDGVTLARFSHLNIPIQVIHRFKNDSVHFHGVADCAGSRVPAAILSARRDLVELLKLVSLVGGEVDADSGFLGHARGSFASGLNVPGGAQHGA